MADIIQQRRDTAARWAQYNPILMEGEVGYVTDNPNQYKIGNGRDRWNNLPLRGYTGTITQDTGDDENAVMSQKATTAKLTELGSEVGTLYANIPDFYKKIRYVRGEVFSPSGEVYTSDTYYRAVSVNLLKAIGDMKISTTSSNIRFYISYYNTDGSYNKDSAWQTNEIKISNGVVFRIVIGTVDDDKDIPIDISNAVSVIKITSALENRLADIEDNVNKTEIEVNQSIKNIGLSVDSIAVNGIGTKKLVKFISGSTDNKGDIVKWETRVVSSNILYASDYIRIEVKDDKHKFYITSYDQDGNYIKDSEWITDNRNIYIGTYFRIVIAWVSGSDIADIDEFVDAINIISASEFRVQSNSAFYGCLTPRKTRFIHHRGMVSQAPENSLPAFRLSGEAGAFAVECDVQETIDKELVLMHDNDIARTTNGSGWVNTFTLSQLRDYRIDVGNSVDKYTSDELVIPTFEDFLKICRRYGMMAVCELKSISVDGVKKLISLIKQYGMRDSCILMLYMNDKITQIRATDPNIHIMYLIPDSINAESYITLYKDYDNFSFAFDYTEFDKDTLVPLMRRINENKNQLVNLYTSTFIEQEEGMKGTLPDFITTDLGTI